MAFEVLDEYEQGEVVRKWLRENAVSMVVGVVLGLALIFGWQQWKAHKARALAEAASQYAAYVAAIDADRGEDATTIAEALRDQYADSPSAVLAALREADRASADDDLDGAASWLQWAAKHAGNEELEALANLNLARVRLAQDQPDAALALLGALPRDSYQIAADELRGDALAAKGDRDAARTAYDSALANLDPQAPTRGILQMKRDEQATAADVAASAPAPDPTGTGAEAANRQGS